MTGIIHFVPPSAVLEAIETLRTSFPGALVSGDPVREGRMNGLSNRRIVGFGSLALFSWVLDAPELSPRYTLDTTSLGSLEAAFRRARTETNHVRDVAGYTPLSRVSAKALDLSDAPSTGTDKDSAIFERAVELLEHELWLLSKIADSDGMLLEADVLVWNKDIARRVKASNGSVTTVDGHED